MTTENKPQVAVIEKREAWQNFQVELEKRATEIGSQLPSNVTRDRFLNASIAAVKQTPSILMATPRSLFAALTKAAQDGLLPDGREGVITVYNQKVPGSNPAEYENVAQWNPMAYGLRKRARELDGIIIDAQVVFDGDAFEYELGDNPSIRHRPAMNTETKDKDASAGVAVYAIFRHPTEGILHREVMTKAQVFATMNQSKAKTSLMWTVFWTEGWRKAVVRRGMKSVPVSPKLEQVIARVDDDFEFDPVPPKQIGRPTPPTPPAEEEDQTTTEPADAATQDGEAMTLAEADKARRAELHNLDQPDGAENEVMDPETGEFTKSEPAEQHREEGEAPEPETGPAKVDVVVPPSFDDATPPAPPPPEEETTDPVAEFLNQIDDTLTAASDIKTLNQFWGELGPEAELADDKDAYDRALAIYDKHKARLDRKATIAAGQADLLGGGNG